MKQICQIILSLLILLLFSAPISGQTANGNADNSVSQISFSDRMAIIKTIENFYIGDHTGSIEHKKSSMHEKGAYRYINREGEYSEYIFELDSDDADPSYKEELLSIEIYSQVALARLRQESLEDDSVHYKLILLHKAKGEWKITSINWGFEIVQ